MEHRILYSIKEATAALGIAKSTLYGILAKGDLKAVKLGGRTFVRAEDWQNI